MFRPRGYPSAGCLLCAALALAAAACTGGAPDAARPSSPAPSLEPVPVTSSVCPPTAAFPPDGERQAATTGGSPEASLWALFFPTRRSLRAGEEVKVVWRMTGSGELAMQATGPDGTVVQPTWGPQPHGGSNWDRPGDEWGTGWVFPGPGCWRIDATRASGSGHLVVRVADG